MGHYLSRIAVTAGLAAVLSLPAGAATSEWKIDSAIGGCQFSVRKTGHPMLRIDLPLRSGCAGR